MSALNKGATPGFDLEGTLPAAGQIPPYGTYLLRGSISGLVDDSPRSPEILFANPELLYVSADRTSGTSWTNSGDLVGNDLTYVDEPIQAPHINFPGTTGNYLSTPDSAPLDFDGNTELEIVVRMAADWYSEVRRQVIVAKRGGGAQSYELAILGDTTGESCGRLMFRRSATGGDAASRCAHPVPLISDETAWIKVTWDGAVVRYYVAPDGATEPLPAEWAEIGSTASFQIQTGAIVGNAETVYIGGVPAVGASSMLDGRIYYLAIRDAIGGTEVLEIDVATDCAAMTPDVTTTFTATSGQTITLAKSGTPPNTCRYHDTLDVTLTFPWYEVEVPVELVPASGELIYTWIKVNFAASVSPTRQLPLVSMMEPSPDNYQGWGTWWSAQSNKIGTWLPSHYGMPGSGTSHAQWSTAVATGVKGIFTYLTRHAVPENYAGAVTRVFSNTALTFGGASSFYAIELEGQDFVQTKLRILAFESTPMDIQEVGIKKLDDESEIPYVSGETSNLPWTNYTNHHARAMFAIEPQWVGGEAVYVTDSGSPTWLGGLAVNAGDWVFHTGDLGGYTLESVTPWQVDPATPYYAWLPTAVSDLLVGDDLVIADDENVFTWFVISAPNDAMYRDLIEGYDSVAGGYIDLDIQLDDLTTGTGSPYMYFEMDGADDYLWGEVTDLTEWVTPGEYIEPIMVAMFLERNPAGDKLWGWSSGLDDWMPHDGDDALIGAITIAYPEIYLSDNGGLATWGAGIDYGSDLERPTIGRMNQIVQGVKKLKRGSIN